MVKRWWKRIAVLALMGVLAFFCLQLLFALVVGVAFSGTTIRRIDINSGRVMEQRFFLGMKCAERIEETPFSRLVSDSGLAKEPPDWKLLERETEILIFTAQREKGRLYGVEWFTLDDFARRANIRNWPLDKKKERTAELLALLRNEDGKLVYAYCTTISFEEPFFTPSTGSHLLRK